MAFGYVRLLFIAEIAFFAVALSLHLSTIISGVNGLYASFEKILLPCFLVIGIPIFAFTKNGMWVDQIKMCPAWMWKGALALGAYTLLTATGQSMFSRGHSLSEEAPLTMAVGFAAISICILHSALHTGYLEESEVVRRTIQSIIALIVVFVLFHHQIVYNLQKVLIPKG